MQLNAFNPRAINSLCITDSRLRPDIRYLEEGDLASASAQKNRLEEKQRDAKRSPKGQNIDSWEPRYITITINYTLYICIFLYFII